MSAFKYLPNCREICTHHVFQGQLWFAFVLLERHFSNFYFCSDGGMAEIKDKPPPVSFQHGILEIATEYSIGRIRPAFIALNLYLIRIYLGVATLHIATHFTKSHNLRAMPLYRLYKVRIGLTQLGMACLVIKNFPFG